MLVKTTLEERGPITKEEIEMLRRAESMPPVFDEDSPELTKEELKKFHRISEGKNFERSKQAITIQLSPEVLKVRRF